METQKRTYYCWAEHTAGGSIAHSCSSGSFADPSDDWEMEVEAANQDVAQSIADGKFREHVADWEKESEACACGKYHGALWNSWWDSVSVIASRKPYPEYCNDDDDQ